MILNCKVCQRDIDLGELYKDMPGIVSDICEVCYIDKEVKDSEKHLKGYDETKKDYLASIDSEGYQGVWGGGRHGF